MKLKRWLRTKKSTISFNNLSPMFDAVEFLNPLESYSSCVNISSRSSMKIQLVTLLHECGHVAIFMQRKRTPHKRIAGCNLKEWTLSIGMCSKYAKRRNGLTVIQEEFEAWERGARLAKRLNIRYSRIHLLRTRTRALQSYINYYSAQIQKPV